MNQARPSDETVHPAADVDARVAAFVPRVGSPAVRRRDAVAVTGAWLSGVSGVTAALRERLPDRDVVEAAELAAGEAPAVVVFVVSAAAVATASDCALLDAAAAHTDAVVCAVSKIDVHRNWIDVLDADREVLAAHAPRYRHTLWVGTAAAPELGEPRVDELVETVAGHLASAELLRRNALRAWEDRLCNGIERHDREVDGAGRRARVAALQDRRDATVAQRRRARSERGIAVRSQIRQARVQLTSFAHNRSASVRGELQEDAAAVTRGGLNAFTDYARDRIADAVADVDAGITTQLTDVAHELDMTVDVADAPELPTVHVAEPPLPTRRLEARLTMVVGVGFGLGMALALNRLFADLAPGARLAGAAVGMVCGAAAAAWMINTRRLLHHRAVLDRWVGESSGSLRSAAEQLVAARVVWAESALSARLGQRDAAEEQCTAAQLRPIDAELREHAAAAARAAAVRDREGPPLHRALETIRAELGEPNTKLRERATKSAAPCDGASQLADLNR